MLPSTACRAAAISWIVVLACLGVAHGATIEGYVTDAGSAVCLPRLVEIECREGVQNGSVRTIGFGSTEVCNHDNMQAHCKGLCDADPDCFAFSYNYYKTFRQCFTCPLPADNVNAPHLGLEQMIGNWAEGNGRLYFGECSSNSNVAAHTVCLETSPWFYVSSAQSWVKAAYGPLCSDGSCSDFCNPISGCPPGSKDSDGDSVNDGLEGLDAPRDTDNDGTPDHQDPDDDGDGVPTLAETADFASTCPACALAANADGLQDSDGDGTPDYLDTDDDDDGIDSSREDARFASSCPACSARPGPGGRQDSDGDGKPNYLDPDDDGDGLTTDIEQPARG